jgi:phosphohistidine phosphatase
MRITIVRHGKAHAKSESGRDRDRSLTERGEQQALWLGERFASAAPLPALILSSPYERAISTARLIRRFLEVPLHTAPELECDEPLSGVVELLERHRPDWPLMIVGHNPQLSALTGLMCRGPGGHGVDLRTGEAAVVDVGRALIGGCELLEVVRMDGEQ